MPDEAEYGAEELVEEQVAAAEAAIDESELDYSQVLTDILTEEESEKLGDAMTRLDQARLYEMLIKHNLFAGVKANKDAVRIVQEEAKNFFMERLQILLGMKQEVQPITHAVVESPFNNAEVVALKDIAYKLTKGATAQEDEVSSNEEHIRPVHQQAPKQVGLRPIQQQAPKQAQPKNITVNKPQPKPAPKLKAKGPAAPASTVPELKKSPKEMTPQELLEFHRKQVAASGRQVRGTSSRSMPIPDADQKEMIFAKAQMQGGNDEGSAIAALLAASGKMRTGMSQADNDMDDDIDGRI
jgi:hypothetical protein